MRIKFLFILCNQEINCLFCHFVILDTNLLVLCSVEKLTAWICCCFPSKMALHYAQVNAMWRNTVYSKRWFSASCFLEIISEF